MPRLGTIMRLDDGSVDPRYELNDHLGNARVVFHKPKTTRYTANMEPGNASQDDQQFQNLSSPRVYDSSAPSGQYVSTTTGAPGPKKTLTVEKGDTVTFSAMVRALGGYMTERPSNARSKTVLLAIGAVGANSTLAPLPNQETGQPARTGLLPALRLGVGVSITGLLSQKQTAPPAAITGVSYPTVNLHYRFYDANNTLQAEGDQDAFATNWQLVKLGFRAPAAGRLELTCNLTSGSQAWFDDVTYEQTGGMIVQEQHTYAYGAPLTGLNYVVGTKKYRHGYQGQYTEKDEETGWDNFELRMYDSRIGRWTAPDPAGQFHSPYVGMGNNPASGTDPDGGFAVYSNWFTNLLTNIGIGTTVKSAGLVGTYYLNMSIQIIGAISLHAGIGAANNALRETWLRFNGSQLSMYSGAYGNVSDSKLITSPNSESGGKDRQSVKYQCYEGGPVPVGDYTLQDAPANQKSRTMEFKNGYSVPDYGLQKIPSTQELLTAWGKYRIRLVPDKKNKYPERVYLYIHDAGRDFSSGCIHCSHGFMTTLREQLRVHKTIRLKVEYSSQDAQTGPYTPGYYLPCPPR